MRVITKWFVKQAATTTPALIDMEQSDQAAGWFSWWYGSEDGEATTVRPPTTPKPQTNRQPPYPRYIHIYKLIILFGPSYSILPCKYHRYVKD